MEFRIRLINTEKSLQESLIYSAGATTPALGYSGRIFATCYPTETNLIEPGRRTNLTRFQGTLDDSGCRRNQYRYCRMFHIQQVYQAGLSKKEIDR